MNLVDKFKEFIVNARKIPLNLEVAFWNFIISTLTIVKSIRTYTQNTSTTMPMIRKSRQDNYRWGFLDSINPILKGQKFDIRSLLIKVILLAILGFVSGLIFGMLLGS